MPVVSIITPFRDAAHFLPGLVANLQQQSFMDWECLLVNHGSKDGGGELAKTLIASDTRFRLIELPRFREFDNQLPAIPRNKALLEAQSELIAFLDVDDLWHPLKLERQLRFHRNTHLIFRLQLLLDLIISLNKLVHGDCPPIIVFILRLDGVIQSLC